ncbi:NUMOD1 domain-containing DNA-binding protein [Gelidibacter japonicus]|uniref:NUMOD1 domain-containing DNA-binding protein n=1 Tax=Gelidibacter japonicus TaxID=1962232 RepID=UPI003A8D71B3
MVKFIVYKVTNQIDPMIYIGVTTQKLESRVNDHIKKSINGLGHYFHEAIGTYGPEAFNWEQIDSAKSVEELAQKERDYIGQYDSFRNGYNSNSGGGFKKPIYQYDLAGKLVNTFQDLDSAANAVSVVNKSISAACLGKIKTCKGFYWSYILREPYLCIKDARRKKVIQMDLNDNFIAQYRSVADASNSTGTNKSSIAKCCRDEYKKASGFKWKYVD